MTRVPAAVGMSGPGYGGTNDENLDRTLSRDQRRRQQHPPDGSAETRSRSIEFRERSHLYPKRERRFRIQRREPPFSRGENYSANRRAAWFSSTCPRSSTQRSASCDRSESVPGGRVRSRDAPFLFSRRIPLGPGHSGAGRCKVIDRTLPAYG